MKLVAYMIQAEGAMTVAQVTTVAQAQAAKPKEVCARDFRARLESLYVEAFNRAHLRTVAGTTAAWKLFERELSWLRNAYDSALAASTRDEASAKAAADAFLQDAPSADTRIEIEMSVKPIAPLGREGMCRGLDLMFLRGEATGRCGFELLHAGNCTPNIRLIASPTKAPAPS